MKTTLLFSMIFTFYLTNSFYCQVISSVDISLTKALSFIIQQQDDTGKFSDSTNQLFNVWETILATDVLIESDTFQVQIKKAFDFLALQENEMGLICHNTNCKSSLCIETSAYYLELDKYHPTLKIEEKLNQISKMQDGNGSWKIVNPDVTVNVSFVSVTAFVVNLFEKYNYVNYNKSAALEYITSKQLADGSWGQSWEYYNCPGYALWQCMKAIKNEPSLQAFYKKGKSFILNNQLEDGSWFYLDSTILNHTSPELQTSLMLQCLFLDVDLESKTAIDKAVTFLINKQLPDGSWDGGLFPIPNSRYKKKEYILATSLITKALLALEKSQLE